MTVRKMATVSKCEGGWWQHILDEVATTWVVDERNKDERVKKIALSKQVDVLDKVEP